MGLFSSRSATEKQLAERYGSELQMMGLSPKETRRLIADLHAQSTADKTQPPPDFAERLLLGTDAGMVEMLREMRAEGVTDDDIKWWWGMSYTERKLRWFFSDAAQLAMFMKLRDDGLEPKAAIGFARKHHAVYVQPDPPNPEALPTGDDRPLPSELMNRVLDYIMRRCATDSDCFMKELESASSFNAFVRAKIKQKEV